jgi:hypothetical protein
MITKTEVHKGWVYYNKGWAFSVWWDNKPCPNFVSALYRTKKTATAKLKEYLKSGKFDFYGDAEQEPKNVHDNSVSTNEYGLPHRRLRNSNL